MLKWRGSLTSQFAVIEKVIGPHRVTLDFKDTASALVGHDAEVNLVKPREKLWIWEEDEEST